IAALHKGQIRRITLDPKQYGLPRADKAALRGGNAEENARLTRDILAGSSGPRRDVVLLNAGMALVAAGAAADAQEGLERAAESIDSGRAMAVLEALVAFTQGVA
ncbi:MAG: anthranilate phosphoribosyltransferase, partial [Chloroflexi bacterium]|nr:anthranilate phosphoribosyltransferase [Chloroflexota bacterium]